MTSPEITTIQQQFLREISRKFKFTGDTYQIFIVRFDPNNYTIDEDEELAKKINWKDGNVNTYQKIKDELKNKIYETLRKNNCDIESKAGRPKKGNEPWKQAYEWLWEEKYPEWLAQQQTQNNQPEPQPETLQINWREVCQKMLKRQQDEQRLRRQITELKHEIEIFVPLGLIQPQPARRKEEQPFPDAAEGMRQYELKTEEITKQYEYQQFIDDVIGQQTKNLAIIGEPGAGKTTWLSKIAEYLVGKSDYPSPIFINLSRLDNRTLKDYLLHTWLEEALEFIPSQNTFTPALVADFQQQFKNQRVWLLLDGVDEMKTTENSPLSQLNSQLEGWLIWTRVILTCRLNVWQPNPIANFDYYRTLAFSNVQMRDFVQQWYEKAEKPELGEQLQQKLTVPQHSRIFDLVKNPLRLAMLCQSWYFLQGELPETKANLYQRFVDATYEWKKGEFGTTATQRQLLNQALGKLALRMIDEQISLKESVIKDVMSLEEFALAEKLGWLNWVYRDQKNDERVYAFFHLSFAEYFAACVIDDWDYFLPKNHVDKPVEGKKYRIFENEWNEIFLLWMGRENIDDKKEDFIRGLINFADGVNNFYGNLAYFKAGIAIAEFKSCSLADEIIDQIIKWGFGYFNIEKQEWRTFIDPIPEDAIKTLSLTDTAKVIPALISFLQDTQDEATRSSVAFSLGNIVVGNEQAIAALLSLLQDTLNQFAHCMVAFRLGSMNKRNKTAIAFLLGLFENTQDEDIRSSVASILENIAVGNKEAIPDLISLLQDTQNQFAHHMLAFSLRIIAVGNEEAIAALISLLQDTQSESIRSSVASILENIAVGNEEAIAALISLLQDTQSESIRSSVASILENIAVGNEEAIAALISLLQDTQSESIRSSVASILENIAVGNEEAIAALISLLQDTQSEDTRRSVAESLGRIDIGNEQAIAALISLLQDTQSEDTRRSVAESLGRIDIGNEQAITALIQLLKDTQDESTRRSVAESLGRIDIGNEQAITALIQLLKDTQDESTRRSVAESLGRIDIGNEQVTALISLLQDTQSEDTRRSVAYSLGKIDVGNEQAITALIQLLKDTQDESTRRSVAYSLGKIDVGNEQAITALIQLLKDTQDESTRRSVAYSLENIAVGNEQAITALIQLLKDTQDESTRRSVAEILGKILKTENNYLMTVSALSKYLTNEVYENNFDLYKNCYKILWQCAKNLTYPKFYQAWHATPTYHPEMADYQPSTDTTTLNQLEQQYTDIYTQLKQLQPTSTTYPIPFNAANLEGKTAEKAIAKGILIKIYGEIYPKQKAKNIEDIFDLENELQPLREHLKTDKIALIFCDINPHPELINFCQQLQNDWLKIAFITDTPIASPLSGFPPQQDNLLGVVQTWLEEL
ncbi:HEAT repeat domain-containing protein [Anabaena azotica]|uniref:HEAT repeat domain-containing protein n=1 Tax=Anabaena azotica TaxID=197653 RepID=UPI0039A5AF0A